MLAHIDPILLSKIHSPQIPHTKPSVNHYAFSPLPERHQTHQRYQGHEGHSTTSTPAKATPRGIRKTANQSRRRHVASSCPRRLLEIVISSHHGIPAPSVIEKTLRPASSDFFRIVLNDLSEEDIVYLLCKRCAREARAYRCSGTSRWWVTFRLLVSLLLAGSLFLV